jgi:hypothetical protein
VRRELDRIWHGHELSIDHDTGSTVTFEDLKPLFSNPRAFSFEAFQLRPLPRCCVVTRCS